MKFVNRGTSPVSQSDGASSIPSWKRRWIEEKVARVILDCGCVEDLNQPSLTVINAFDGASIDCVVHHRFAKVVKKYKLPKTQYPVEPLF